MPLNYDQITAVTQRKYIPKLVDNIFDSDPLLKRAKEKGWYTPIDGGTSIFQPLMYAQVTAAGSYAPTATLDTTDNETFTSAEYAWKHYYANITISGADEMKNMGDSQVLDFVKNKVMAAEMTLKDKIGDGLYSAGTTSTDIGGLRLVIDTANTVGGIDQSTYSWWQASTEDSTTTTLTMAALQTAYNASSINGKTPTVITATRANYNRYYALLQPQQRFVDQETAKAGFQNLMFNGTPFIVSAKCPANHIFMINEEFLALYYHPKRDFVFDPFIKSAIQDLKTGKIYWMGNLGSSNNRMHGKLTAVAA
jgi:hypothetical protein